MEWELKRIEGFEDFYYLEKEFGGTVYRLEIYPHINSKSVYFHVALSSGSKRKHLGIFEDKGIKNVGSSIKPLLWVRDMFMSFPEYYLQSPYRNNLKNKKIYLAVAWADIRRRNIYSRLQNYGFKFMNTEYGKLLVKRV